jgi:molybdopterin-containing oxidoreductase family iron-sulfur binding subunit
VSWDNYVTVSNADASKYELSNEIIVANGGKRVMLQLPTADGFLKMYL